MDSRKDAPHDLVCVAQRIQNLSYVLALNPHHNDASASLRNAIDAAAREAAQLSDPPFADAVEALRRCTTEPLNGDGAAALREAAARFHEIVIWVIGTSE